MSTNKNTAPAAFSVSNLAVTDVTEDEFRTSRRSKVASSPFVGWLKDSFESGTGKAVTVPAANVKEVVNLIRGGADHLGIGARIVQDEPDANGNVTVKFQGRERRGYNRTA